MAEGRDPPSFRTGEEVNYWGGTPSTHTAILRSVSEADWWQPEHRRLRLEFIVTA